LENSLVVGSTRNRGVEFVEAKACKTSHKKKKKKTNPKSQIRSARALVFTEEQRERGLTPATPITNPNISIPASAKATLAAVVPAAAQLSSVPSASKIVM